MERREFFKGFAASLAAVYSLPQIAQALSGYLQELADDLAAATDPAAYWAQVSEEFRLSSGADSLQLRQYRRHASGDRRGSQGLYRSAEGTKLADAQQFYSRAALFVGRLPSRYEALAVTCEKLAGGFDTYRELLRHVAANHLGLLPRLSMGETFHLERRAHEEALPRIEEFALDQMLDAYNEWRAEPNETTRERFFTHSDTWSQLRPGMDTRYMVN